jgi:hypothetical protein
MAARKDLSSFGGVITRALRMIALFFVPFSLIMVVLGQPLVQLVYDTGRWPAEHVRFCGLALSAFSAAMFFYAIENVVMQSFFSIQRMWMPTVVGVVASCAQIAFLYVGIVTLGYNRPEQIFWFVIVAFPMSRALKNILLLFILRYHVPILPAKETVRFCVRLAGVAGATVAVTYFSYLPIAKVLGVSKLKVEDVVVDTFNPGETNAIGEEIETRFLKETGFLKTGFPAPACWREARGAALRVENVSSADREPEFALRVDKPGACLERDISRFDLGKVNILSFKVKADREAALRVMLIGKNGRHDQELGVAPSTKRLEYEVKLDKTRLSEIGPIQTLVFADVSAVDATGALWLDTVVFQGDFSLGRRVLFEALKLAQAAIPMALGIVALLATAMALRIEEVGMVFAWLREEGLARIKEKLKGGKRPSAPSGTKAGPVPDVDG